MSFVWPPALPRTLIVAVSCPLFVALTRTLARFTPYCQEKVMSPNVVDGTHPSCCAIEVFVGMVENNAERQMIWVNRKRPGLLLIIWCVFVCGVVVTGVSSGRKAGRSRVLLYGVCRSYIRKRVLCERVRLEWES